MMNEILTTVLQLTEQRTLAANPALAWSRAAAGDLVAFRALASMALEVIVISDDQTVQAIGYAEAITFARLAAHQGNHADRHFLLSLLCDFGKFHQNGGRGDICTRLEAAGLLVAEGLANDGDEAMADMIVKAGEVLSAETFVEVKRQRESAL